ncbi:acyl-peptide hydrolase [Pseudidiomarina salinarum]|uniref:Acyl-peptide hydrolase n=1 Tax=Pseudidiomarina salinarum TaxID=435908 RepID=A0A094ITZ3_9GAMM|nr:S9 family peptidase [Pseudidiomarina salinarum]KFZ31150.1 acyl-peptide hydrolase [Pseudidiomarina salinarum]RUO71232.1 S9 family peptidase [Pseudidiomarina salinarum]
MNKLTAVISGVLLTASLAPNLAQAQVDQVTQAAAKKKTFQPEDIFNLEHAGQVEISPDGKQIVYVRTGFDVMKDNTTRSLWLIDVATGQHTPLFADQFSYGNLSWSPDSSRLAFTSNRQGSNQIYVYWLAEQQLAQVTDVRQSPGNLSWSPDGKQIGFIMSQPAPKTDYAKSVAQPERPDKAEWGPKPLVIERTYYQRDGQGVMPSQYRHVFVVPAEGGTARQLTQGAFDHSGPLAWRGDSQSLILSANRNEAWEYQVNESDLWHLNVQTGEMTQLTSMPGQEFSPVMSPNYSKMAFLHRSNEPVPYHNSKLHVLNWQQQPRTALLQDFDRSVESPQWLSDDVIAFQYSDRGRYKLASVTMNNKRTDYVDDVGGVYISRPYISGSFSASAQTGLLAYTQSTSHRPADVATYATRMKKREAKQIHTALNADVLGQRKLGEVKEITYKSSFDGTEIHGWYILPPDYDPAKTYPTMVEIHGGPHLAYGPSFAAEHQRYAAEGYVVFYNNYRGSVSYGKDFALLLDGYYSSERDFADHMSGLDALIEKGIADADNLFIAGGSAGGIATAFAVGLTDRFRAAAATNPVINWVSKTLTADSSIGQITNQFPAMPWEDYKHYWERSPLSLVANVNTPTLLFSGEQDRRVPMSEIEQFYQALQLRKVDTAMVRVPEASHSVTARPSHMIAKIEHTLAWFKHYRKD